MNKNKFDEKIKEIEANSHFKNICLNNYEFRSTSGISGESKMLMGFNNNYCLDDFSFRQFLDRTGLNCSVMNDSKFMEANNELVETLVNRVLSSGEDRYSNVYIRNNKILAAHSKNYKPLQISELINILEGELQKKYHNVTFESGFYSDEFTIVDYSISSPSVIKAYKRTFDFDDCDVKVIIRFVTSNLGLSGANLYPLIAYRPNGAKNYVIVPTSERVVMLKHEGNASLEKFRDNVTEMFALTETLPEQLDKLNNIIIEYPTHCCINLAERAGIPAKYISDVAESIAFVYPNRKITARQLYLLFSKVIESAPDEKTKFVLSEKVAKGIRILKEGASEIDVPKIKWKRLQNITADEGQYFIPDSEPDAQMSFAC